MTNLFFRSDRNYLKRDPSTGSTIMAAPVTSAYSGGLLVRNLAIPHGLAPKIPICRVYYEPWGDGSVWPGLTSRLNGSTRNPRGTNNLGPGLIFWPDATNLNIQLYYDALKPALTGTFSVYYIIYRDYSLI